MSREQLKYTDLDLDTAVDKSIFSAAQVAQFRQLHAQANPAEADEESFRLITGFNDIFVVIACALLLLSSRWLFEALAPEIALFSSPVISWCLAEYFVRKRRMALPAIVLLLVFVSGIFELGQYLLTAFPWGLPGGAALTAIAAWAHWRRFHVPITVAAGTAAAIGFVIFQLVLIFPDLLTELMGLVFVCGLVTFWLAMRWDSADRTRASRQSDVAFWLHLLSAPLIVHPVFVTLGLLRGEETLLSILMVISLYFLMTLISLVIDRRAFMVSALIYVIFALSSLFNTYGIVGDSFAVTGVCIGLALLMLSAFWHPVRRQLVPLMPNWIQHRVPGV